MLEEPGELRELLGVPFTDEQLTAITAPVEPGVIVAGAGSGKTTVMAARVVWLVGTGAVGAGEVLGLTFTNKAAAELGQRVRAALLKAGLDEAGPDGGGPGDEAADEPTVLTYHAYAGRLIAEHGLRIGLEPSARLLADATRYQLASRVVRRAKGPFTHLTGRVVDVVKKVIDLDGQLSDHLIDPDRLRAFDTDLVESLAAVEKPKAEHREAEAAARARLELVGLVEAFRAEKRGRELMDFSDQMALAARLAAEAPAVGEVERQHYAAVLLDEYQDTSVGQARMLAALFGGGHPVTAVGDPCQGIYGWRGASATNLDAFPHLFPRADGRPARRYTLTENRRSGGRLLAFANRLSEPLRAVHAGVEPLRPRAEVVDAGWVRCALLATQQEEREWLADRILDATRSGTPYGEVAVLVRTNAEFAPLYQTLTSRGLPVEVVGLGGLLNLPEVTDLVATLEVLDEPTANAALVRLLAGPRWRIGPRDLALLGRRARELVMPENVPEPATPQERLAQAAAPVDPTETVSLSDAVADPGDELPFSAEARKRFARFASEIRMLRRGLGDSVPEIVQRVLAVTGLEVEVSVGRAAIEARRRETVDAFLDVAASFTDLDGDPSLTAFLAFLRTAETFDRGLESALPSGEDSVKLLTAHKSKGLEWDIVAVPGLVAKAFPSAQPPSLWTRSAAVVPTALRGDAETCPDLPGLEAADFAAFREASVEHSALEELRLGYVTFTRPRNTLIASGHWWGPTQKKLRGPSAFLQQLREHAEDGHGAVEVWAAEPEGENPALATEAEAIWPHPPNPEAERLRRHGAALVRAEMARLGARADGASVDVPLADEPSVDEASDLPDEVAEGAAAIPAARLDGDEAVGAGADGEDGLTPQQRADLAVLDRELAALVAEAREQRERIRDVALPPSLTATQLVRLATDPDGLARELVRPMPRPPAPAARRGVRFHAWVESRFADRPLLEPEELPGFDDDGIGTDDDLAELQEAFLRSPYAGRVPHRVEEEFRILLAGRVIRGRIDAVYRDGDRWEVVDWKTGRIPDHDPVQLAIYRLAWAEAVRVPPERVDAAFLHVRSGAVVRPDTLLDRAELERLLADEG